MTNLCEFRTFEYDKFEGKYVPSKSTIWVNMDNVLWIEEAYIGDKNTKCYWLHMLDGKSIDVVDLECIGIDVKWS